MKTTNETYKVEIYINNVFELYTMVQNFAKCIENRISKGMDINFHLLVNSSIVNKITTEVNKYLQKYDSEKLSPESRKEAKRIIASAIIEAANENIEFKQSINK